MCRPPPAHRTIPGSPALPGASPGRHRMDSVQRSRQFLAHELVRHSEPALAAGKPLPDASRLQLVLVITQHDHAIDEIAALRRELGRNTNKLAACIIVDTAIFAVKGTMEAV